MHQFACTFFKILPGWHPWTPFCCWDPESGAPPIQNPGCTLGRRRPPLKKCKTFVFNNNKIILINQQSENVSHIFTCRGPTIIVWKWKSGICPFKFWCNFGWKCLENLWMALETWKTQGNRIMWAPRLCFPRDSQPAISSLRGQTLFSYEQHALTVSRGVPNINSKRFFYLWLISSIYIFICKIHSVNRDNNKRITKELEI